MLSQRRGLYQSYKNPPVVSVFVESWYVLMSTPWCFYWSTGDVFSLITCVCVCGISSCPLLGASIDCVVSVFVELWYFRMSSPLCLYWVRYDFFLVLVGPHVLSCCLFWVYCMCVCGFVVFPHVLSSLPLLSALWVFFVDFWQVLISSLWCLYRRTADMLWLRTC